MKLTRTSVEEGKEERNGFSRAKTLAEGLKRRAVVAALVLSAAASFRCGGEPPGPDGGDGGTMNDGGTTSDGGTTTDGGTGGDGGTTQSLCEQYGEGSPNRATFTLGQIGNPSGLSPEWQFYFKKIEEIGGTMYTTFARYQLPIGSSTPQGTGFADEQTRSIAFSDVTVTFQLCGRTPNPCAIGLPGGSGTGDTSCTATIAADRPFGM